MQRLVILSIVLLAFGCQQYADTQTAAEKPENLEEATPDNVRTGKPMLPAYPTLAELDPGKADQYDDYKDDRPNTYGITMPPTVDVRPVAEYEPASKLIIAYSSTSLPGGIEQNLVDIVKYGYPVADVHVLYDSNFTKSSFEGLLANNGVASSVVNWMNMDNGSIWIRDYGPLPIVSLDGTPAIVDLRYYHQRVLDDAIPTKLGDEWGLTVYRAPLDFEGGNFMSDTQGNCFASQGLLWYNAVDQDAIEAYAQAYMGCSTLTIYTTLEDEGTTHIDMQSKLVDDNTVLIGEYTNAQDAGNKQVTDQNAAMMNALGYNVVRMPMPTNSDGAFRSYINSLFVNGVNMVPVYSVDNDLEAEALAIWEDVMPDWNHVPMNSDDVIQWAGAIHCITMTVADGPYQLLEDEPAFACDGDWDCYPNTAPPQPCGDVTWEGCCQNNTVHWCEDNELHTANCGADPDCGWVASEGYYWCGTNGASEPSGTFPKECSGGCTPDCNGLECGDDGCGGTCGSCASGESCVQGQCVTDCEPDCSGKECGDDGCGGSCGSCDDTATCQDGQCVSDGCGNLDFYGCCDGATVYWCEEGQIQSYDCGSPDECGWDANQGFYNCGGGNGVDPSGEHPRDCNSTCEPNCDGQECGDDGCGGTCGTCAEGEACAEGTCVADGCGDVTYDGYCEGNTLVWCENGQVQEVDCSQFGNYYCGFWEEGEGYFCIVQGDCVPNCEGKECGDDGCGGTCGTCDAGLNCIEGTCSEEPCESDCDGKECGDDGCGGSCGTCAEDELCQQNLCVQVCQPQCDGKECGADGCGGSCGACQAGFSCVQGSCVEGCSPNCTDKECGDDGCGGTCGACDAGEVCTDGQCATECLPNCVDKQCGSDGCGGFCGSCPKDFSCEAGKCVPNPEGCGNVTSTGLCEGDILKKCIANEVVLTDCAADGKVCSYVPDSGIFACVDQCIPNCIGKQCGPDGCGGQCGACAKGMTCDNGTCKEPGDVCTPDCDGKQCGDDGCGGSCGACVEGAKCSSEGVCVPNEHCPDGQSWDGEKCVEDSNDSGDETEVSSSGCSVTHTTLPVGSSLLLLSLLAILALAYRKESNFG